MINHRKYTPSIPCPRGHDEIIRFKTVRDGKDGFYLVKERKLPCGMYCIPVCGFPEKHGWQERPGLSGLEECTIAMLKPTPLEEVDIVSLGEAWK